MRGRVAGTKKGTEGLKRFPILLRMDNVGAGQVPVWCSFAPPSITVRLLDAGWRSREKGGLLAPFVRTLRGYRGRAGGAIMWQSCPTFNRRALVA
jgi:hypothetical protein